MHPTPIAGLEMFAQNIALLIGGLVCMGFLFVMWFVSWTAAKMWLFHRRQKRALVEYRGRTRRADGQMYPPRTGGICDGCGMVKKTVYHLPAGDKLCSTCYEPFWRAAEGWSDSLLTQKRPADGRG